MRRNSLNNEHERRLCMSSENCLLAVHVSIQEAGVLRVCGNLGFYGIDVAGALVFRPPVMVVVMILHSGRKASANRSVVESRSMIFGFHSGLVVAITTRLKMKALLIARTWRKNWTSVQKIITPGVCVLTHLLIVLILHFSRTPDGYFRKSTTGISRTSRNCGKWKP